MKASFNIIKSKRTDDSKRIERIDQFPCKKREYAQLHDSFIDILDNTYTNIYKCNNNIVLI